MTRHWALLCVGVCLTSAFVWVGTSYGSVIWWRVSPGPQNTSYAEQVFDGVVAYDRVLASRRWHHKGNWCTYALVALGQDADPSPPPLKPLDHGSFSFGSDSWMPTPGSRLAPRGDDQWSMCRDALGPDMFDDIANAFLHPGGYWHETADTVFLYSPSLRIAIRLREGD